MMSAKLPRFETGTRYKFYTSVAKGLKLKIRKFWGLIHTFVEVIGKKTGSGGGGAFWLSVNIEVNQLCQRTTILFMDNFLLNGLHEKVMICYLT